MAGDLNDVRRKVRGLLAMAAENSGATPAEKITARTLADHLLKKHDLAESDTAERKARPAGASFTVHSGGFGFSFKFNNGGYTGGTTNGI